MTASLERHPFLKSIRQVAGFLDAIPVPIFRTTLEGEMVFCNTATARCLGYDDASELIGTQVTRYYRNIKDRGRLIHEILTHRCIENHLVALKRKGGRGIWCTVTARADLDEDDMVIHLDGMLRDVTARVEDGKRTTESDAVPVEKNCGENQKFKGVLEMAGGVAHLVNQPLTVATNLVNELVADNDGAGEPGQKLLRIQEQIQKLNDIIRKVVNIHQYAAMEYVGGIKIVDIDNASLT
jgi:PAS domain S-box-containing protein